MEKVCKMFGGEDAEALNALMTALFIASEGEDGVYEFMGLPKTSFIVELHDALKKHGYKIVKK